MDVPLYRLPLSQRETYDFVIEVFQEASVAGTFNLLGCFLMDRTINFNIIISRILQNSLSDYASAYASLQNRKLRKRRERSPPSPLRRSS